MSISTQNGLSITFLSSLAALLDNEIGHFTNSILYILLLFTTLLIVVYSGAIISEVIAPPEEICLTNLYELEEHNFSHIFPDHHPVRAIMASILKRRNRTGNRKQELRILEKLMKTPSVLSIRVDDSFLKTLVEAKNTASIIGYYYALWHVSNVYKYIASHSSINANDKKCYVGKEMIDVAGESFVVLTPPGCVQLARGYQKLLASGLIQQWEQEAIWLMSTDRVQDRARVVSSTTFVKEATIVRVLIMEGKIATIFLLWMLCLIGCGISLCCEALIIGRARKSEEKHIEMGILEK